MKINEQYTVTQDGDNTTLTSTVVRWDEEKQKNVSTITRTFHNGTEQALRAYVRKESAPCETVLELLEKLDSIHETIKGLE